MSPANFPADDPERLAAARPWRQRLWEHVPKWARIGISALCVLAVVHIALGIRIWYGLQDPPEVLAIRQNPRGMITYRVDPLDASSDIFDWLEILAIGLRGRSVDDVHSISMGVQFEGYPRDKGGPSDKDVEYIARHFQKIEFLELSDGVCSTRTLLELKVCRQLNQLWLYNMDIDDGVAELLPHLPNLYDLSVTYTNTGNGLVEAAIQREKLISLDVSGTNVTQPAIDAWVAAKPGTSIQPTKAQDGIHSFYRWSDGSATWFLEHPLLMEIQGPFDATATNSWPRKMLRSLGNSTAWISPDELESYNDGTYRVLVSLVLNNDHSTDDERWELLVSEPAEFEVMNGVSRSRWEIPLPMTRDEAMRRIPHDGEEAVDQWIDTLLTREGVTSPRDRRHRKIPRR